MPHVASPGRGVVPHLQSFRALWLAWLALLVLAPAAAAEPRTALVIGNGAYSYGALANATNDADDMARVLGGVGFEVIAATDVDHRAMDEAIDAFRARLAEKGGVGLFYFSGHGVRVGEENYLLPIGEALTRESDVKYEAVPVAAVMDAVAAAGNSLNIVVLDACRNNPLQSAGRAATRGLTRVESGAGTFISFSTSPGAVALDGEGRNSPFTKHLVAAIARPGLTLEETFKETLKGVHVETGGAQTPWISSSFFGDFIFNQGGGPAPSAARPDPPSSPNRQALRVAPPPPRPPVPPVAARSLAGIYRAEGTNPNGSRYSGMVAVVGDDSGSYAFTWWIGREVFHGEGQRDGRWLRVDWGQASPVIYTQDGHGILDGIWADGRASEILTPHALADQGTVSPPAGRYRADGSNPDGGGYSGRVEIERHGGEYRVRWTIGSSSYSGRGRLAGNILTVDWGDATPVVYAVGEAGVLTGLWAAGSGEEVLTPSR